MPLRVRSATVLLVQVFLLMAIAISYDVPSAALISVAASSLYVATARNRANREPRLVPAEAEARRVVADLASMGRRLAHEAGLSFAPRPMVIPGLPSLFVLRTRRPRLVMSSGLINAVMHGRLQSEQIEPLIAHEIAHLTDVTSLWGEVLTMAVRMTVIAGLIGLPLSVILPGSEMSASDMSRALLVAFGALIANGLLFGSWLRLRELRADADGAGLLGPDGRLRLSTALRAYVQHELVETINRIVMLDRPAVAAAARKQLAGNTAALGDDLRPLAASLDELADRHTAGWSDLLWRGSRRLSQLAIRGGTSHPSLDRRLRALGPAADIDSDSRATTLSR